MAKIAIIMAAYNGEKYIGQQIESILNNTYQDFELHVCDDCSTDTTGEIVKKYEAENPGKVFYHLNEKNLRVKDNFLSWTMKVEADYYMFSDQDDFWKEYKIKHSMQKLISVEESLLKKVPGTEKVPGTRCQAPVVVFGDAQVVDVHLKEIHPSFQKMEGLSPDKLSFHELLMENKLIGCTLIFNRALRDMLSKVPGNIKMHDWWIGLVAAAFGKVAYLDEPLLCYRQHGGNTVGSESTGMFIKRNLTQMGKVRQQLYDIFDQGGTFLACYRDQLPAEEVAYLEKFSTLYKKNWFARKAGFLASDYRKTGFVRNLGMFILI